MGKSRRLRLRRKDGSDEWLLRLLLLMLLLLSRDRKEQEERLWQLFPDTEEGTERLLLPGPSLWIGLSRAMTLGCCSIGFLMRSSSVGKRLRAGWAFAGADGVADGLGGLAFAGADGVADESGGLAGAEVGVG